MIHRRTSPFKRFLVRLFTRMLILCGLALILAALRLVQVRAARAARAVTIESPPSAIPPPQRGPDSLRLITYNIAHGRGPVTGAENTDGGNREEKRARLVRMGERLAALNPDIVFLQEVDFNTWWSDGEDQAAILAAATGLPYVVRQRNFDTVIPFYRRYDFGNALLSRFPVEAATWLRLPPYSHLEEVVAGNPDGLSARIRVGADQAILLLGAQFDRRAEDTRVAATSVLIRAQRESGGLPVILLGNLNSTPPGLPGTQSSASGQNAIELLESFGGFQRRPLRGQTRPEHFTFPALAPRRVIDWIMPDRNWAFVQYEVIRDLRESDHLPVLAALTLRRR